MTALRKQIVAEAPVAEVATAGGLKNVALFFAAPFIGLAYIVALPFYGLAVLAMLAARVAGKNENLRVLGVALKQIAMAIAAPFVGLAFVVFFPVIGLALLLGMAGKAATARA
jgi:hypothetical protein